METPEVGNPPEMLTVPEIWPKFFCSVNGRNESSMSSASSSSMVSVEKAGSRANGLLAVSVTSRSPSRLTLSALVTEKNP